MGRWYGTGFRQSRFSIWSGRSRSSGPGLVDACRLLAGVAVVVCGQWIVALFGCPRRPTSPFFVS